MPESNNKWLTSELGEFDENSIDKYYGFIYQIINLSNLKTYIGRKAFHHIKTRKLTKKELAAQENKRKKTITEKKDSGWRDYWGTCNELKDDIKKQGEDKFVKRILMLCSTKKQLTYYETYYQMHYEVLFNNSYNDNILGKFYRKDFMNLEDKI